MIEPRARAPRQNLEQRQAMIVAAALDELAARGPSVTTLQIARAAGISEPTIFRAFADKNDLLAACLAEATDPRHVVDDLSAIDRSRSLRERLVALIEVVRFQSERTSSVVNAISLAGGAPSRRHVSMSKGERTHLSKRRTSSYMKLHDGVAGVLEPDAAHLRLPISEATTLVLAIVMALGRGGGWDTGIASITTEQLSELLLHGLTM